MRRQRKMSAQSPLSVQLSYFSSSTHFFQLTPPMATERPPEWFCSRQQEFSGLQNLQTPYSARGNRFPQMRRRKSDREIWSSVAKSHRLPRLGNATNPILLVLNPCCNPISAEVATLGQFCGAGGERAAT